MTDPGKLIELDIKPRPRIIVADDEQAIASLIEDWLSDAFEVTIALNGKAAIQKAVWQRPDVILCDVVMPDMGGYEVARALQATPQTQGVPLIMMTAKNYDDSTVKMIKAEPNVLGFINKPFKPSELIKMIHAVMKGQRAFQAAGPGGDAAPAAPPVDLAAAAPVPPPATYETRMAARAEDRSGPPAPSAVSPAGKSVGAPAISPAGSLHGEESSAPRKSFAVRWVRALFRLFVWAVVAASVLGGVGEILCRWTEGAAGAGVFLPPIRPARHPALPYQFLPNARWREGDAFYQMNSWGLRDREFDLVASTAAFRVMLLGGTAAFGAGSPEQDLLARRLEKGLSTAGGPNLKIQVINAAFWAFSPEEQWAYFEKEGFQFRPQIVAWLVERRPAGYPSKEGLRRVASWGLFLPAPLGRIRLLRVLEWRLARGFPAEAPAPLGPLAAAATAFAGARGARLVLFVPRAELEVPPGAARVDVFWDKASNLPAEEVASFLAKSLAPLLSGQTSGPDVKAP